MFYTNSVLEKNSPAGLFAVARQQIKTIDRNYFFLERKDMIEKNEKKVLQAYERPIVELVHIAADVLAAGTSTDVGSEYMWDD